MSKTGFVYILTNKSNTVLYIGVTSSLLKRIWEHKTKVVDSFTSKYRLNKLVYFEMYDNISLAIEREKYLKGKSRKYKEQLINTNNSSWLDLYDKLLL